MPALGATLRIFSPCPNVLAFYDGRIKGMRAFSAERNWLDDGAYELGVCTYAIVDGEEALVYDTHISLAHAHMIRWTLTGRGVTKITVVLSHWHDDHIAGNEVFADCEIIANARTAELLEEHRGEIEAAFPPIRPLVTPNRIFEEDFTLSVGRLTVELRRADIHSEDATLLILPEQRLLFAGDALEDPVTYVGEPERLGAHLADLDRIAAWPFERILPNHGAAEIIEQGGYGPGLVGATKRYVEKLLRARGEPALAAQTLQDFIAEDLAAGTISYFAPYEAVHRQNIEKVAALAG